VGGESGHERHRLRANSIGSRGSEHWTDAEPRIGTPLSAAMGRAADNGRLAGWQLGAATDCIDRLDGDMPSSTDTECELGK
jgi:hypothetical protein